MLIWHCTDFVQMPDCNLDDIKTVITGPSRFMCSLIQSKAPSCFANGTHPFSPANILSFVSSADAKTFAAAVSKENCAFCCVCFLHSSRYGPFLGGGVCRQLQDERSAPQDQIFFLLNDGFIRQISCSSDSEPSVIEIYPCVNSTASQTRSRAVQGGRGGLPSKYKWEMSADLGDLPIHIPGLTFPSKGQPPRALLNQRSPRWELLFVVLRQCRNGAMSQQGQDTPVQKMNQRHGSALHTFPPSFSPSLICNVRNYNDLIHFNPSSSGCIQSTGLFSSLLQHYDAPKKS